MKIILIGFMGSGKSTVGHLLAQKLNLELIEMDDLIVRQEGKSINKIFSNDGEAKFRELETQLTKDLSQKTNIIISTGGGVVTNKINIDFLKKKGKVVFLETSFEEIEERLKNVNDRPLFKDKKKARELFIFRQNLYEEYADLIVSTDGKSAEEISNEIISQN